MKNIIEKIKSNKKIFLGLFLIIILFFGFIFFVFKDKPKPIKTEVVSKLIGNYEALNIGEEYIEKGIKYIVDGVDKSNDVLITNNIDSTKLGKYKIVYKYKGKIIKTKYINVIDNVAPILTLKGSSTIQVVETASFIEPGYSVTDNYNLDLSDKVIISGSINTKVVGVYTLKYSVSDSSFNITEVTRTINVTPKPKTIAKKIQSVLSVKDVIPSVAPIVLGTVSGIKFSDIGISINGSSLSGDTPLKLVINNLEYELVANDNIYSSALNLASLPNGEHMVYLKTDKGTSLLVNTLDTVFRIKRAKIGDKLIALDYTNNNVKIIINNFSYEYDILIDVGHGGFDTGATNLYTYEKHINLEVSKYEKERYESMGLKVKLTREDDSYGLVMGPTDWLAVRRRAYAVGYYGTTSKYVYSNHHNASSNVNSYGFEMLIPATKDSMVIENNIYNGLNNILKYNTIRMYTKNYDTNAIFNKGSGQTYNFTNWYAMNRIPYELFNKYVTVYEGCYMSNVDEFIWYYNSQNWKSVSEVKIKAYVEALGKTYINP